jgi:glycosyltransferase involved in cell wall biosynthesis
LVSVAVRSVLAQRVDDLEVVVVDDGSDDGTRSVLDALAREDGRVRAVCLDAAGGAPAARNAGIAASTGAYVAYCDDDDEWLPGKLEAQLAVLDADPRVVVVGCHHALGDGTEFRGPTELSAADLLWANFLGGASNVIVRRSATAPFDEELATCQDWDHWLRCAETGSVVVVDEVLVRYRDAGADRLTASRAARLAGHRRLFERHRGGMSPRCRAYHRARHRILAASSEAAELRAAPWLALTTRPDVTALLAGETLAARRGAAAGDPARGLRWLHAQIGEVA